MTAITTPARRAEGRPPVPWRRLGWATWRQHRAALAGVALLLCGLSAWMLINGLLARSAMGRLGVGACRPITDASCAAARQALDAGRYLSVENAFAGALQAVPALVGVFIGGPLLARELESGTFRFAWTQGCGRLRWVISRLVPLAVLVVAGTAALSLVISWYSQPFLATALAGVFQPTLFDLRGVDLAAWTLAAFALAAFAGLLIRRTVAAMAAAAATWAGLLVVTTLYLRQHYQAPLVARLSAPAGRGVPWVLSRWWTGPDGRVVPTTRMYREVTRMRAALGSRSGPAEAMRWLARHGYLGWQRYQPAGRFWHFQLIESGGLVVLAVLLGAATIWLVRRRSA